MSRKNYTDNIGPNQMRHWYLLGEKNSGLKPRGPLQDYEKLKKQCLQIGVLFADSQFDPEKVDLLAKSTEEQKNNIKWLRPSEITKNPIFIGQTEDRFDVNQGSLGDCWFLAALANVTLNSELMQFIVPSDQSFDHDYAGIFHFRFWQYGRWIDIVIDDRLPTYNGKLIYVKSKDSNVFWTSLLEKAYAKLYRSYANIEGGLVSEALEDLTGGLSESYSKLLKNSQVLNFFDMMQISFKKKSFMGCAIQANSDEIEKKRDDGLYAGHAYSITDVAEANSKLGKLYKLLRIRNPWGQGEWNGDWSDDSEMWSNLPGTTRNELLSRKKDGEFWMQYEQFVTTYTFLELCHMNLDIYNGENDAIDHWNSYLLDGAWIANVNSGGLPNNKNFIKNPQYILTLDNKDDTEVHRIIIGLMQKNRRIQNNLPELRIGFAIFSLKETPKKKQLDQSLLNNLICMSRVQCVKQITGHLDLKSGIYCIVPFTESSSSSCEFLLRIYSSVNIDVEEHDEEIKLMEPEMQLARDNVDSLKGNNAIQELYKSIADKKTEEISWIELHSLLQTTDADFSREICRSMVALADSDRTGTLNIHEFFHLWEQLGLWRGVFRSYDSDNDNCISASELREALRSVNIQVTNRILDMLLIRFGNEKGGMEMQDFIHCCIKLIIMLGIYNSKHKEEFSLEEWLLDTIYS